FARQHDGLQGIGELVDVQDFNAVQLGNFVEVEIVGDDLAVVNLGQLDQLHIDFAHVREIILHDLHVEMGHFLDALQDIETAAAAIALHRIRRIRDQLQFPQNELRDHQHAVEKSGFSDVGDSTINDHAGVQNLECLLW